jgi:large subunit ribosomal protein L6
MSRFIVTSPLRSVTLPDFLVPAFTNSSHQRFFSNAVSRPSRIGAAPLSIPPDVQLTLLEPVALKDGGALRRAEPLRTLEVKGPLGQFLLPCSPAHCARVCVYVSF